MSEEKKLPEEIKKRAPTLYVIIAIKLLKGLALILLAFGVYSLTDNDLPEDFRTLLQSLHLDPEKKFFADLETKIAAITPGSIRWIGTGVLLYSLFSLVEGIGLIFRVRWAGWLAIGESIFFIPLELFELMHGFSWKIFVILAINIWIVWYLLTNRHRLFRHHHH